MNILVFAQFAGSPRHGMVFGHYYLGREWLRARHNVTIVAAAYSHMRIENPVPVASSEEEVIDGIRYVWISTRKYDPSKPYERAFNIIEYTVRVALGRFHRYRPDLVVCSSHHPFPIYAAHKVAKKSGAKLIFEVRDLWPKTLIELGRLSRFNPFISLMQRAEDYAYKHSDSVVSVLPATKNYMMSRGMMSEKFAYIPNGVTFNDKNDAIPPEYRRRLMELRASTKRVIGYVGTINNANMLSPLIDALAHFDKHQVCAAILGGGPRREEIISQVREQGLTSRILIFPPIPRTQIQDFLSYIDIAYCGVANSPLYDYGISLTKMNDYLLSGTPVIAAMTSAGNPVPESGAGITCPPDDAEEVRKSICIMLEMHNEEFIAMGRNGKMWILQNRDYRVLAERFLEGCR